MKYLVEQAHVNVDSLSSLFYTPLREATFYHRHDVMNYLLDSGANYRIPDNLGLTPMAIARSHKNQIAINLLTKKMKKDRLN